MAAAEPLESSSWTLISSSSEDEESGRRAAPYGALRPSDAEAAKSAAADEGTSVRKALCSPPINNGVDAVTKLVAAATAADTAAAAGDASLAATGAGGTAVGVKLLVLLLLGVALWGVGDDCCLRIFMRWWRRHFARLLENQT